MKQQIISKKLTLLLLASGIVLTVTFSQNNSGSPQPVAQDTIPTKQKKIIDLDEALAEIDQGEMDMQRALKEIDRDKLEAEIRKAMKNIDMDKIKEDITRAMKDMDREKIMLDMQKCLKEIDCEKIKQEVNSSLAKVDMEKMKAELAKVKEIDFSKMKAELAAIQPQIEKAMKEAQVSIEATRKEITAYKNLVNALDKDGLLNKSEEYTIAYKNKELIVNGKKLPAETAKKYQEYLNDRNDFTLQKSEDGFHIDQ